MVHRDEIVNYLDELLRHRDIKDYTSNGLQIEGCENISKIGFAVDGCLATVEALKDCQMIVVHHGLWWPSIGRVVGRDKNILKTFLNNDINLYVSHLPLDKHEEVGNNAQIIKRLGCQISSPLADCGWCAELNVPLGVEEIISKFADILGDKVTPVLFGSSTVRRIAVCSGAGANKAILEAVRDAKADIFLTGEFSHPAYHMIRELGLNVVFGGHYRTEVFGVQALQRKLSDRFGVKTEFFDCPTGF